MTDTPSISQLVLAVGGDRYEVNFSPAWVTFSDGVTLHAPGAATRAGDAANLEACLRGEMPWEEHLASVVRAAITLEWHVERLSSMRWREAFRRAGNDQAVMFENRQFADGKGAEAVEWVVQCIADDVAHATRALEQANQIRQPLADDPRAKAVRRTSWWAELTIRESGLVGLLALTSRAFEFGIVSLNPTGGIKFSGLPAKSKMSADERDRATSTWAGRVADEWAISVSAGTRP